MPDAVDESAAFSPPSPPIASGADQAGVRLYNERLILSLVRRFGQLSKIEVARMTGLSVQSTSAIMNRLQVRRPVAARGAVARPRRPADGSGLARSRGRVFAGAEDRPPQLRSRLDRLLRNDPAANPSHLRLSDAQTGDGFPRRSAGADDAIADAGAASPHRGPRRRLAVPIVELAEPRSARRRRRWTRGDPSRSKRNWRASVRIG